MYTDAKELPGGHYEAWIIQDGKQIKRIINATPEDLVEEQSQLVEGAGIFATSKQGKAQLFYGDVPDGWKP